MARYGIFPYVIFISGIVTVVTALLPQLIVFLVLFLLLVCGMAVKEYFSKTGKG